MFPEPEEPQTVKKRPPPKNSELDKLATNRTRFSILMEKKQAGKSLLDGRESIAWENPALSSTQKVNCVVHKGKNVIYWLEITKSKQKSKEFYIFIEYAIDTQYLVWTRR